MTEQTWKERFRKQYQYWDLTSEEDLSDLEAFIAAELATARAEGAAEEREKWQKKCEHKWVNLECRMCGLVNKPKGTDAE